jgi:hypothetical protein
MTCLVERGKLMKLWLIAAFMFAPLTFAQDHGGHGRPKETSFGRPADAKKASRVVRVEISGAGMGYTKAAGAERALDELFRGGAVARTAVLGTLLSDAQLARYDALRGYAAR